MEETRQDDVEGPTTAATTVNAIKDEDDFDGYVSLDISKEDSDQDKRRRKSVLYKTTEQLGATYTAMGKSKMVKTLSELRIPPPISRSEVRDMEQALAGDYQLHNRHFDDEDPRRSNSNNNNDRRSIICLPDAKDVKQRLDDKQVVDNLTVDSAARRYRFLVPFILKAEISPGLAFAEALLTWILVLSVVSILFHGVSFVAIAMGGLSLFATLTITQFWYGVCRYPSIWNNFVRRGLKGVELDENFSEIRDICTRYCNGPSENSVHPQQMTAFLTTLPFTIIYHMAAFLFTVVYFVFGGIRNDQGNGKSIIPTPVTASIFASNLLILFLWAFGGTFGVIFAALSVHFNQVFYNSLLFRRDVRDFVLSIFLGGLLIVQDIPQDPIPTSIEGGVSQSDRAIVDLEEGRQQAIGEKGSSSRSKTVAKPNRMVRVSTVDKNTNHVAAAESSDNSILVQRSSISQRAVGSSHQPSTSTTALYRPSDESRSNEESDQSFWPSQLSPTDSQSVSRHQLKFLATVLNSDTTINKSTSEQQVSRAVPSNEPNKGVAKAPCDEKDDVTEMSDEFLNPSDVHLDLENHPGTITWRNVISESIQRFPVKTYTFRKHNWIMKRLHGRNFYIKENGQRRRQLGRSEVKKRCKNHHNKQMDVRLQIAGILSDLKDLKKIHESKSSSGHSRKSNSNKPALLGIPSKDPSLDAVEIAQYTMNTPARKSFADPASTAKDAKTVESSKESTVSTLTCSQLQEPPTTEARSTPWIEGKPETVARDPDTTPPINNSTHLRNAIYGILDYTAWLENLNKLSGDSPWNSEHKRSPDEEKRDVEKYDNAAKDPKESSTKAVGGEVDIKSGGGIELVREESKKRNGRKTNLLDHALPKSIHWDKQNREFVNTADVRSRQRRNMFRGFWRRALHQNKHKKLQSGREQEETKPKEPRKDISFWRRKNKDISVTILQNDKIRSSWGNPIEPVRTKKLTNSKARAESRQDEPNTPIPYSKPAGLNRDPPPPPPPPPPPQRKRRSRVPPKDPLEVSPYEAILSVMDEEYLRTWEGGDSSLDTKTKTVYTTESSSGDDTKKVFQDNNTKTTTHAFCGPPQECDALDGFTNVCALQTTSHDYLLQPNGAKDVFDDEVEDDIVAREPEVKVQGTPVVATE